MAGRILVIRGGAIGDFILTLPALRLLREAFPDSHIEILGYPHILAIADGRYYANATRSIEYSALSAFFNPGAELDAELQNYFTDFQQVISYLYDPDGFFEYNLRRCGVKNLLLGNSRLHEKSHAIQQLSEPMAQLGLYADENAQAIIFPSDADKAEAAKLLEDIPFPRIAIHPGSGGARKNWPLEFWLKWIGDFYEKHPDWNIIILGGESDGEALRILREASFGPALRFIEHAALPLLAAILGECQGFLGHDSGISHLAAAVGCRSLLLFGPTDPKIWAPRGTHVQTLKSPTGAMKGLLPQKVTNGVESIIIAPSS